MPTRAELIATGRTEDEIARHIEADGVIYQDLEALKAAVREANPKLERFEASCFDGNYVTGDVTTEYLAEVEHRRDDKRQETPDELDGEQADLSITA
jgi:amidophosphoribosyltransferase